MDQIGDLQSGLGWIAPGPGGILTFLIRLFFVVAALAALFQLLAGAFLVIVSGGEKEKWNKAFSRMGHAILGVFLIIVIFSGIVVMEQRVFNCAICFGISCPLRIPSLMGETPAPVSCQ
jgi:ABC-type dipeptide/oligopeptide/nickel transport system permease subunit